MIKILSLSLLTLALMLNTASAQMGRRRQRWRSKGLPSFYQQQKRFAIMLVNALNLRTSGIPGYREQSALETSVNTLNTKARISSTTAPVTDHGVPKDAVTNLKTRTITINILRWENESTSEHEANRSDGDGASYRNPPQIRFCSSLS